jgi:hypothetical protein
MDDTVAVVLVVVVVEVALPVRLLELPPQPASNAPAKMQATTDRLRMGRYSWSDVETVVHDQGPAC